MKRFALLCFSGLFLVNPAWSQEVFSQFKVRTFPAGASAISADSLTAKTISLRFPVYDVVADTENQQLIFSCRQPGDGSQSYFNKAGFAALDYKSDTLLWKNETALYDLHLAGKHLIASNEKRAVDFHLQLGYDRQRFEKPLVYITSDGQYGLMYADDSDALSLVNIATGKTSFTATIPRQENWSDVICPNDSTLLIAAAGLHCLHLKKGLSWSYSFNTAKSLSGPLVYSPANATSLSKTGSPRFTASAETQVTQLSSNILVQNDRIYFANSSRAVCVDFSGKLIWECDLADYDPAKMVLTQTEKGIVLVNFGLGLHSRNYVILNEPFVLMLDQNSGEIIDQYGLAEIGNLIDFTQSSRGLGFAGKNKIVEIRERQGLYKSVIPVDKQRYGDFKQFIDGETFHTFKEGYYVPLNFIDDQLVYFVADNNKVYGISADRLVYEYHFTELHRLVMRHHDHNILEGLDQTLLTSKNFELLGTIFLSDRKILLKDKLYFFEGNRIHVIDLEKLH